MKKLYLLVAILAAFLFVVSAVSAAVQIDSITSPSGNPGSSANVQVTVKNTNTAGSVTVVFTSTALTGPGGSITAPTITNLVVPASGTGSRTFSVSLPFIQSGAYSGTLQVKDSSDASNTDEKPYSVNINSVFGLDVTDRDVSSNKLVVTGDQGDSLTATFNVKNTGSEPITDLALNFNQVNFQDSDTDKITITHNMPTTLAPGADVTVTLTLSVNKAIEMNTYDGTVTVNGGGKTDSFLLEVRIQPEVCSDGRRGSLNLDLRNPDDGDDFKPGQKIPIEAKVENNANEDLDITVTAFLFDVDNGDNVEEVDSETTNINEDDTETFNFDLTIPADVDEKHQFKLFIKGYEDGNEDEQCDESSVKLDIKREKNDVIVKSLKIDPPAAKAGDTVTFTVTTQNIGSRDQDDVIVKISNSDLSLDVESKAFTLEKFDNDDTQVERLTFKIPEDAKAGTYDIEAAVDFDSKTSSTFGSLRVEAAPKPPKPSAALEVSDVPTSVDAGKSFDMAVKVSNTGTTPATFDVGVRNIASWAESVEPQTLSVAPGKTATLFFTIRTKQLVTGVQSASVGLLSNNEVLDSEDIKVDLKQTQAEVPPITGFSLGTLFSGINLWIVADIVLVIIAIVFIRLLFKAKRKE